MKAERVNFRLSDKTLNMISERTKLNRKELMFTDFATSEKLMIERGAIKKPSKIIKILSECYQKLGEKLGLIEKRYYSFFDD